MEQILQELGMASFKDMFRQQKITPDQVPGLTDQEFFELGVRTIGDRVRLREKCRSEINGNEPMSPVQVRIASYQSRRTNRGKRALQNNRKSQPTRRINIGWKHDFKGHMFKLVDSRKGGGRFNLDVNKDATMLNVQTLICEKYFPNGENLVLNLQLKDTVYFLANFTGERIKTKNEDGSPILFEDFLKDVNTSPIRIYLHTAMQPLQNFNENEDGDEDDRELLDAPNILCQGNPCLSLSTDLATTTSFVQRTVSVTPHSDSVPSPSYFIESGTTEDTASAAAVSSVVAGPSSSSTIVIPKVVNLESQPMTPACSTSQSTDVQTTAETSNQNSAQASENEDGSPTILFHPRYRRNRLSLRQSVVEPRSASYRSYVGLLEPICIPSDSDDEIQEEIPDPESSLSLVEILVQLQSQVKEDRISKFNITRTDVMDGARRSIHRKTFSAEKKMDIRFTDTFGTTEGAIDEGGPKREFLRMLMFEIQHLPLFEGPDNAKVLSCNAGAIHDELFKDVGVLIALSICHGGPAPKFFSDVIYNYLVYGRSTAREGLKPHHIADEELRMQVTRIQSATNLEELHETVDDMATLLIAAGCYRHIADIKQKDSLVEDFTSFLVLGRTSNALQQLAEGLETLEVLGTSKKYPEQMRAMFVLDGEERLTADVVEVIFNNIDYSPQGSNVRWKEEKVIGFWRDFIMDVEEEENGSLQLTDILAFATGADKAPPLGFNPEPTLKFTNSSFPRANTCALELHLPLHDSYREFKDKMIFGILNSPGFGRA